MQRRETVMSRVTRMVGAAFFVAGVAYAAVNGGFNQQLFDQFVELRVGTGDPVYWYMKGEVYSYPDGELIAIIEGFDTGRVLRPEGSKDTAYQLSRKIYVYRNPETGELLEEYNGNLVTYIEYPYQYITLKLEGDELALYVEQTKDGRLQKIGPVTGTSVRRVGETVVYSAPMFLNIETPRGKYEAYENYDFFLHAKENPRYQLAWNRFADRAPWAGTGRVMLQMIGWRVDRFENLPGTIRTYVEKEAPLWKEPPRDMDEIRELQKPK
jgi:hypothetical protein